MSVRSGLLALIEATKARPQTIDQIARVEALAEALRLVEAEPAARKETSERVARIAGKFLPMPDGVMQLYINNAFNAGGRRASQLCQDIRSIAASALGQDEASDA